MSSIATGFSLLKLAAAGSLALLLGVFQLAAGGQQGILGGSGALLAGVAILSFVAYFALMGGKIEPQQASDTGKRFGLLWLGIFLTLAPGLMYLYLHYSMDNFDPAPTVIFLGLPILLAGIACVAAGLWSLGKK